MTQNDPTNLPEHNGSLDTHTILYIEDDAANRQLVEFILARRPDLTLIEAENGKEGVKMAFAYLPNLILLDLSLPDTDGFEVLKELLENTKTMKIPTIAISGNSSAMDIQKGLDAGFDGYLTKPVNIETLYNAIDTNLGIE